MPYELTICRDHAAWNRFVAASPQGAVFCATPFLDALGEEYELLVVEKDKCPQLGAVVLKHEGQPVRAPYPFTMYQGVLMDASAAAMPAHARSKWLIDVVSCLLENMEQRYAGISFCLHHEFDDLRAFQWFHFENPAAGQFTVTPRYTGLLDLVGCGGIDGLLGSMRTVRRYDYRRSLAAGLTVDRSTDIDTLDRLHEMTFARQGIARDEEQHRLLRSISTAALANGFGWLFICRDKQGNGIAATLFVHDGRSGYYLFGAGDPEMRKLNGGSFLLVENLRECLERGLTSVDFVGINSPDRGDFKTSFNARPTPYFHVDWARPDAMTQISL